MTGSGYHAAGGKKSIRMNTIGSAIAIVLPFRFDFLAPAIAQAQQLVR